MGAAHHHQEAAGERSAVIDESPMKFVDQFGVSMRDCLRFLIGCLLVVGSASAAEVFVDNLEGRDAFDGTLPVEGDGNTGPVRSLARAVQIATFGDVIVLKNAGLPYYDSLSLTGRRHSGTAYRPFKIVGNGATLSGLRSVPREGWVKEGPRLWKLTATRKGFYQLLRNGQSLPETLPEGSNNPLLTLAPGHWVSWRGSLYFQQDGVDPPTEQLFAWTADQTGISLHDVSNVLISNLTLQHFRFDGLHAQGICDHIELDNVTAVENGRAGIASSGGAKIDIFGGTFARNGRHQILAIGRSTATQHNPDLK